MILLFWTLPSIHGRRDLRNLLRTVISGSGRIGMAPMVSFVQFLRGARQ
jgi:hypothetical protein